MKFHLTLIATLVLTPAWAQEPKLRISSLADSLPKITIGGLAPNELVQLDLRLAGLNPLLNLPGAAARQAMLLGRSDAWGRFVHQVPVTPAALAGQTLVVQAHSVASSGLAWTAGTALLGPAPQPFNPVLVERGQQQLPSTASVLGAAHVAAGDLDGDGTQDIVLSRAGLMRAWVQAPGQKLLDASGQHLSPAPFPTGVLTMADLDADGDPDLIAAGLNHAAGHLDQIWWMQAGRLVPGDLLPFATAVPTSQILSGDVNGDGRQDLLVLRGDVDHNTEGERDSLWIQNAGGGFSLDSGYDQALWNEDLSATTSGVLADVDGDGDLDIFLGKADPGGVTGLPGGRNVLLVNAGDGTFTDVSDLNLLPRAADQSFSVTCGDLDGDGDLDLIVANSILGLGGVNSSDVLLNQGGFQGGSMGVFRDELNLLPESPPNHEAIRLLVHAADFNLDGALDVFFGVHDLPPGSGGHPLFLGNASGSPGFARVEEFETGSFIVGGSVLFDLGADGDFDLFLTSAGSAGGGDEPLRARLFVNTTL